MTTNQSTDSQDLPTKHSYPFPPSSLRAQPLYVVDGDTADLFVDTGLRGYHLLRFRFLGIDTPELRSRDEEERKRAKEAKAFVQDLLETFEKTWDVNLKHWPLRIETAKDPDSFGRWLAQIFFTDDGIEKSVNAELLNAGLAVVYEK